MIKYNKTIVLLFQLGQIHRKDENILLAFYCTMYDKMPKFSIIRCKLQCMCSNCYAQIFVYIVRL